MVAEKRFDSRIVAQCGTYRTRPELEDLSTYPPNTMIHGR